MDTQFYPNELNKPKILHDELTLEWYVLNTYCNDDGHEEFTLHTFDDLESAEQYVLYDTGQMSHDEYFHIKPYELPDPKTTPHTHILDYRYDQRPDYTPCVIITLNHTETKGFTLTHGNLFLLKQKLLQWKVPPEALEKGVDLNDILNWLKIPYSPQALSPR